MKKQEEKEYWEKLTDNYLYSIGFEHVNNIIEEYDCKQNEINHIQIPDSLNQWVIDFFEINKKRKKQEKTKNNMRRIIRRIAACLLVLIVTSSIVTVSVEAFRVRFLNLMIETSQRFADVRIEENTSNDYINKISSDWNDYYYPAFIPKGFVLESAIDVNGTKHLIFNNESSEEIMFIQGSIDAGFQLDTEDGKAIEVDIKSLDGLIVEKDGAITIVWYNNKNSFYLKGKLEKSILLKMAESVEKNN